MEKYNVDNHLFYDGYKLDNNVIGNPEYIEGLLRSVNKHVFDNEGSIKLLPYFNGKYKEDEGVSGIILGNNFHFTCHTFSNKNTVFVDYFGVDNKKEKVLELILDYFDTDDYDMGSKDKKGYFGKHIIIHPKPIELKEAKETVKQILKDIDMTPIMDLLVKEYDDNSYDILQPIAESHISFHKNNDNMVVDAFSCKYFDVDKFLSIFGGMEEYTEVNRGLKYVRKL